MNIIDIVILVLIAFGFLIGFKRGFTRELVSIIGIFAVLVLSFLLKNPVSVFLYRNFPFFNFGGIFKDITVLNILLYEILSFIFLFIIFTILLKILLSITKIFEKILTVTIILGIPSKILGGILGIVQSIIYIFIALYILTLPVFNLKEIEKSNISNLILDKTPFLNNICEEVIDTFNEVVELKNEYSTTDNTKEFNQKALNIMIDKGVISKDNALELIKKGKIKNVVLE